MKISASAPVQRAIRQLDGIEDLCDAIEELDIPDSAEFVESVREQARAMRESVLRSRNVTNKMSDAMENWESGLSRWLTR